MKKELRIVRMLTHSIIMLITASLPLLSAARADAAPEVNGSKFSEPSQPVYEFKTINSYLRMADGERLAVTYYMPITKVHEKFPVIIEEVPYRKDDFFYIGDYEEGSYFARRGYVFVRIDVRGTGGSTGPIPWREYSEDEIEDLVAVVGILSKMPWSNGNVGMSGISWSAFNALMVASRKPPALKAIIGAHGSGDLFFNDIHYIDGVMHFDLYCQQIDTDNALPASPAYSTSGNFFTDRFNQTPWIFRYFKEQKDSDFWRQESVDFKPPLTVPAFLVGGLLDGYRDFVPKIFENSTAFVKGDIGPWNHAYPDYGKPGPNYDWYGRALRWWDYWLKGNDTGILDEPRLMVYLRSGDNPATTPSETSGKWQTYDTWPIPGAGTAKYYPNNLHALASAPPAPGTRHNLTYAAGAGMAGGGWWGEQTGDMSGDDKFSLVYDFNVGSEDIVVIGMPKVSLLISADAPGYNWTVRLEDVWPDNSVSLVSGGLINPLFRESRLNPKPLDADTETVINGTIHFTTWTFKPGHKIRLAVSNAQFPMAWPTPNPGSTDLFHGADTWIELPLPPASPHPEPTLNEPCQVEDPPDARNTYSPGTTTSAIRDDASGDSTYTSASDCGWKIKNNSFHSSEFYRWYVNDFSPEAASYDGMRRNIFNIGKLNLDLACHFLIESDSLNYYLTVNRTLSRNGKLIGDKTWWDTIKREQQTAISQYRIDDDSQGYFVQDGNIFNMGILSVDPNNLKAEYEAGFIQGKLQKDKLQAARDNAFDGFAILQEGISSANPPSAELVADLRTAMLENYDYTMTYIEELTDPVLKEQMSRLSFRLLGIFDGASKDSPQPLDFSGAWLPRSSTFTEEQLTLNYDPPEISFMDIYFLNSISDVADAISSEAGKQSRCSAFIRKTANDIFVAHNTWSCYLDRSIAMTYYINGDYLCMNSCPVGIIGSNNDFGYNNKGMMFAETTLLGSGTPKSGALWTLWRSALAEQFAGSLEQFYSFLCLELSGTYMSGYMLADTKTREIGLVEMSDKSSVFFNPDGHGGYDVTTSPEGLSLKYDNQLLTPDSVIGINMPVSYAIRKDLGSVDNRPMRRNQFRAGIRKVVNIESAKDLITYTPKSPNLHISTSSNFQNSAIY
jgi:predicted acyl esterase